MSPDAAAALAALDNAHRQLLTALWLSGGMLCSAAAIALLALGWRRCALLAGLGYGATLCFIPVGPARWLGPGSIAAATFGLLRPSVRRRAAFPPGGARCPQRALDSDRIQASTRTQRVGDNALHPQP